MPPLTPGTNKKLTEVLKASFASWEKEVQHRNITKGKCRRIRSSIFCETIEFVGFNNATEEQEDKMQYLSSELKQ